MRDAIKQNIFLLLTEGVDAISSKRRSSLEHYKNLAAELQPCEDLLHSSLKPQQAGVVKDKKFLLFSAMCRDAGVEDDGLWDTLVAGASLIGRSGSSR